jgi:hypothetical protein
MSGNDGNPPQGFQNMQQLMSNRYPQTQSGAPFPGPFPNLPNGAPQQQQQQRMMQLQMQRQQMQIMQQQNSPSNNSNPTPLSRPKGLAAAPSTFQSPSPTSSKTAMQQLPSASRPPVLSSVPPSAVASASPLTKKDASVHSRSSHSTPPGIITSQQKQHLQQCDWKDKTLWATRQILGGNSINGFLRATATSQRIKKQRARQLALTKKSAAAAAAAAIGATPPEDKKDDSSLPAHKRSFNQSAEEQLKKDIMNPRTAKKIKAELEAGVQFCVTLHNLLRGILFEVDTTQAPHLPTVLQMEGMVASSPQATASQLKTGMLSSASTSPKQVMRPPPAVSGSISTVAVVHSSTLPAPVAPLSIHKPTMPQRMSLPISKQSEKTTASPGNPGGSTLRKQRRKKLPPNIEPTIHLSEFDDSGKRLYPKKEHNSRLFQVLRFRALKQGDFVAARLSSRDLWILARVLKDYSPIPFSPNDFLQLSESKRDAVFREKVLVKDVEDAKEGGATQVARSLILPLPRTYSEAAEWCQRCKKGSRVYAMYPQTTSLYSATVIDNITYCRDDDDIIVVEFDGEEPDVTGQVPKYHIPARFVTLIPREFPASQSSKTTNKRKPPLLSGMNPAKRAKQDDDPLGDMFSDMDFQGEESLDNFDALDLDFNKPLPAQQEDDDPTGAFLKYGGN